MIIKPLAIIASDFPKIVIPLINNAKESIRVIVFDWRFYPTVAGSSVSQFNSAIAQASKRGINVRALVNSETVIDRLCEIGCTARKVHSKRLLHTKMILIDDVILVIGSHNYTQNGFGLNHEASILVQMPDVDNDFKLYFDRLWGL